MPKINPDRATASEANLAHRIAYERAQRGMKQATLARKMTQIGCPMQGSTIYKIESGDPPRRVTVDELVGFCRVFGVDPSEMLTPMALVMDRRAAEMIEPANRALRALADSVHSLISWQEELVQLRPKLDAEKRIPERVKDWFPSLMISYPLGDEDDDAAPDPVWDAWQALSEAISLTAEWRARKDK